MKERKNMSRIILISKTEKRVVSSLEGEKVKIVFFVLLKFEKHKTTEEIKIKIENKSFMFCF